MQLDGCSVVLVSATLRRVLTEIPLRFSFDAFQDEVVVFFFPSRICQDGLVSAESGGPFGSLLH